MKTTFAAIALAAALAQPASATTFPTLTTIYVGSGVTDSGEANSVGNATTFHCTNVSGQGTNVRFLALDTDGSVAGSLTLFASHGATVTASTHGTGVFLEGLISPGIVILQGGINIESQQSGVFCTAMIVDAVLQEVVGVQLHLVRVNPHPGTVE